MTMMMDKLLLLLLLLLLPPPTKLPSSLLCKKKTNFIYVIFDEYNQEKLVNMIQISVIDLIVTMYLGIDVEIL